MKVVNKMGMLFCLGGAFILGGCQSTSAVPGDKSPTRPAPSASESAPAVTSPSPAVTGAGQNVQETSTPAATSTPAKVESDTISARLTDFVLLDEQRGYVWGVNAEQHFRLYLTIDGGVRWKEVPMEDGKVKVGDLSAQSQAISFLDQEHIWIAAEQMLYTTEDGGLTWKTNPLPASHPVALQQIENSTGYLLTSSDAAMSHSEKSLYVTKDGGVSWKKVMQNLPAGKETPQPIPQAGHASFGMTFRDASNGWVPLVVPDDLPHLYRSKDGGAKWQEVVLDSPASLQDCSLNLASAPVFFGPDQKEGWVSAVCYKPEGRWLSGYFTNDGGESWTFVDFGKDAFIGESGAFLSTFVNRKEGWIVAGGKLLHTVDGGVSWSTYRDATLTEQMKKFGQPLTLQFATARSGWLLLGSEDGTKSVLLSTSDGGQHWKVQ